jgi:hypothetical protein
MFGNMYVVFDWIESFSLNWEATCNKIIFELPE